MKRRLMSILAVLALCLTMLPMAAFAAPISWPAEGESVTLDGVTYTYLGDVSKCGFEVYETAFYLGNADDGREIGEGFAGICKAGEGYLTFTIESGLVSMTLYNVTIAAMQGGDFPSCGIDVSDYDVSIHGIGTNVIEAAGSAIEVTGCLTMTGDFQRIAGENTGILCMQTIGLGEDEITVDGGDCMINANIDEIVGTENVGLYIQGGLIINGSLGDVSGGTAIDVGKDLTINGTIDAVKGFMNVGIGCRGDMIIGEDASIGQIEADTYGIYVDCDTDEEGAPIGESSLTILGQVGPIRAAQFQQEEGAENWVRFGIYAAGGDVVIAEGAVVESVYGDNYGVYVEGGQLIQKGSVPGGITGGEMDIYEEEWPSAWAHAEVMEAILWGLVPEELQCKYTQATTRAEYCALATCLYEAVIGESIELTEEDVLPFTDVEDDVNIAKMYKIGVVNGVGENRFAPNNILTREQAATMLSRLAYAVGQPLEDSAPDFADNDKIFDYAYEAVGQVQAAGIMEGKENKLFDPKGSYTREQSILTMDRLFNLVFWDNDDE